MTELGSNLFVGDEVTKIGDSGGFEGNEMGTGLCPVGTLEGSQRLGPW